jgi:RNA polymerase sigma factor (TIGR02999 family)
LQSSDDGLGDLIERSQAGDEAAAEKLMPLVYDELRRIAGAYMKRERPGQTIEPTALVHEAYLRLLKGKQPDWQGRTHFLAIAATSMRQILVERARAKQTAKRGGGRDRITLDESTFYAADGTGGGEAAVDLLAIDEALDRLAELDAQQARIVELRFFGGLTIEETGATLDISPATVKRHWTVAKAWLRREILAAEEPDEMPSDDAAGEKDAGGGR